MTRATRRPATWRRSRARPCAPYAELAGVVTSGLLGVVSCDLPGSLDELGGTLLEPEPELLVVPGSLVVEGRYSELHVEYSLTYGPVVRALNHDAGASRLSFTTLDRGTCVAGRATRAWSYRGRPEAGLVAYTETPAEETPEVLRFAAYDCSEPVPPLPHASVVYQAKWESPFTGLTVLTGDDELVVIDEMTGAHSLVSSAVSSVRASDDFIWFLEGTELIQHTSLRDRLVLATNVDAFVLTPDGYGAYLEEGQLYVPRGSDGSWNSFDDGARRTRLASDACSFGYVPRYENRLTFLSPCGSRRLNVWEAFKSREFEEDAGNVLQLGENSIFPQQLQYNYMRSLTGDAEATRYYYYVTNQEPTAVTGELWVSGRDGHATRLGDGGYIHYAEGTRPELYLDWDGTRGRPVIAELIPDGDRISVVDIRTREPEAPRPDFPSLPYKFVVFGDGLLRRWPAPGQPLAVYAENIVDASVQELKEPRGLSYLIDPTPTGATLRVYLVEPDMDIEIARNVTESIASEIAGILYATGGAEPGIWWARPR